MRVNHVCLKADSGCSIGLGVIAHFVCVLCVFVGCSVASAGSKERTPPNASKPLVAPDGRTLVDSRKQPVVLKSNPKAVNVPWKSVADFIRKDNVNRVVYQNGKFECTEYAAALHDRALARGIRCAFVALEFAEGEGHALNAFYTTDLGLVFIDCTGSRTSADNLDAYDSIGYVVRGKPYGRLPLDVGASAPNRYSWYAAVEKEWAAMGSWKKTLDDELARLARLSRVIEIERQALEKYQNKTLSPVEYQKAQALINQHKTKIDEFNRANGQHSANANRYNQLAGFLRNAYESKPFPVKTINIWW